MPYLSPSDFVHFLKKYFKFTEESLDFSTRPVKRFIWEDADTYDIVQSIDSNGYFSHYSAMMFNHLTEQIPKQVFFNIEQTLRAGGGVLTQQGIDNSFGRKCRTTNRKALHKNFTIHQLNGANTGRLGVSRIRVPDAFGEIQVTNVERTLIDAVVRPVYSGGVFEVAKAFANARNAVSVNKLVSYLKTISYTYPYHQSIGFYLEIGGYRDSQLALLQAMGQEFDFYLDYALKETKYIRKWRIYVPSALG